MQNVILEGDCKLYFVDVVVGYQSLKVVRSISYPDHHAYTEAEFNHLEMEAESIGAVLVTTEKDKARLPYPSRNPVEVVPVEVVWDDERAVVSILAKLVKIEEI